ncbi:mitochondrial import receptor subunit TOM22 homolog [Toxorhynchites rutilus septentrionalis]|uniref:mitochondrial import receptor subunit TOM22 homolog n=1 Tax=Toxorhynchites rutilus septentrionalis TaxID=329112 RepID=UPI002479E4B5|nr:mitochondrial import receptor subunit TOM22 homolog [Toxorhynchites rutilus septentrionalis]
MDSDPEVVLVDKVDEDEISADKDSGMESAGNSKDDTPERKSNTVEELPREDPPKPTEAVSAVPKPQQATSSTAQAPAAIKSKDEDCDDEPDETLQERLWGLTEMFPEGVRSFSGALADMSIASVKALYSFTCNASWIFFTSSMILFAPVVFEVERAQMEEMQKTQQKQVLLGPGSAVGGGVGPGGMPAMPPMGAR